MRVLLAYDASPGSEEAAALVLALPWPSGSSVRVIAVVEPSAALVSAVPLTLGRPVTSPEIDSEIVEFLKSEVARVVGRLQAAGIKAEGDVLRGRPATVVVDEADEFAADLIVAGSRGHGPIASLVLGSVSAELVDHAPCPVLVARRPEAKRVIFASDGSASANHAEEVIAQWSIFDDVAVRVVSVAEVVRPWHTGLAPTMYRQVVEAYAKDLDAAKTTHEALARSAAERLRGSGRTADEKLRVGDAAGEIIEEASSWHADLIVLGSRGLTGLTRILLGSVARNVLQGGASSVLVVRESATVAGEGARLTTSHGQEDRRK
jgi:nucleotide-binding universal stress UspA family protein